MLNFGYFIKFCLGGVIAWLMLWGAGAIFLTSPTLYSYQERLGFAPRAAETWKQERSENWVTNHFGELGFGKNESRKLHSAKPKVVIYGDSYIEAAMIPESSQMQNLVSCADFDALGVGYSGTGAPEYCFLMRRLPLVVNNIAWNVVFVGDIYDLKGVDPQLCRNDDRGALPAKSSTRLDRLSAKYRLFSLRALMRQWRRSSKLNWLGNDWRLKCCQEQNRTEQNKEAISNVRSALKQAATKNSPSTRLLIVYAPTVPRIHQGRVLFEPEDISFGDELKTACVGNGIDFIDLGNAFCAYYQRTGKFPRGFFNTPPGEGHLNEQGHAIAAKEITRYIDARH